MEWRSKVKLLPLINKNNLLPKLSLPNFLIITFSEFTDYLSTIDSFRVFFEVRIVFTDHTEKHQMSNREFNSLASHASLGPMSSGIKIPSHNWKDEGF